MCACNATSRYIKYEYILLICKIWIRKYKSAQYSVNSREEEEKNEERDGVISRLHFKVKNNRVDCGPFGLEGWPSIWEPVLYGEPEFASQKPHPCHGAHTCDISIPAPRE